MQSILVVEDEVRTLDMIRRALSYEGYSVLTACNGAEALDVARECVPDLIVMDWMMPGMDGPTAVSRLRNADTTPILMLTGRDSVEDKLAAFDAGVDDFLAKPFAPEELIARVRAMLRRRSSSTGAGPLRFADVHLDPAARVARRGSRAISLTRRETELLAFLMRHPQQVLRRDRIVEGVWGGLYGGDDTVLEVYVGYVRTKLEAGGECRLIQTIRGVGYALREPLPSADEEKYVASTSTRAGA